MRREMNIITLKSHWDKIVKSQGTPCGFEVFI